MAGIFNNTSLILRGTIWLSSGQTTWNHNIRSAYPIAGNPSSELTYKNLHSPIIETEAELRFHNNFYIKTTAGFGEIINGKLIDDDFLNTGEGDFLASRSASKINGENLWYINLNIGKSLIKLPKDKGVIKCFTGYQHWNEKTAAQGLTYEICTLKGYEEGICPPETGTNLSLENTKVITNEVTWDSLLLGIGGKYNINERVAITASAAYSPSSTMHNEDTHHLRGDLDKPSFVMDGLGTGFHLEAKIKVLIEKNLYLTAGYRLWQHTVKNSDIKVKFISYNPQSFPLNDLSTQRDGAIFSLNYIF
jgi:hypothetical protein